MTEREGIRWCWMTSMCLPFLLLLSKYERFVSMEFKARVACHGVLSHDKYRDTDGIPIEYRRNLNMVHKTKAD
jgi:hypothetical protein